MNTSDSSNSESDYEVERIDGKQVFNGVVSMIQVKIDFVAFSTRKKPETCEQIVKKRMSTANCESRWIKVYIWTLKYEFISC